MSLFDDFLGKFPGPRGVRTVMCGHGLPPPTKGGWCFDCDRPPEQPHQCPKPPTVRFKVEYDRVRAVGMGRAPAFIATEHWRLMGWITSGHKQIAGVFLWLGKGEPVAP